jgi:predicted glycoside hydrolase/deacetylase ChbG (UPF0249 family)
MKYIIINADDFGYSDGINRGIIKAHTDGVLTSTSLMVYEKLAEEAKKLNSYPNLSVGLHFVLPENATNISDELLRQIDLFIKIMGKRPSHLDAHKIPLTEKSGLKKTFLKASEEYSVPVRELGHVKHIHSFFGLDKKSKSYDKNKISPEALIKIIDEADDDFIEIMTHPGYCDAFLENKSSYNKFREIELKTLTSSLVKKYIDENSNLKLINWGDVELN